MQKYTATEVSSIQRQVRVGVLAAMESGNFDRARTIITEAEVYLPEYTESLRQDVIEAYGLTL